MNSVQLDPSKMLGFKILQTGETEEKLGSKIGNKPVAPQLGSKMGAKLGMKPGSKTN